MGKLLDSEIEKAREVKLTSLLAIAETGRKQMIRCPFHAEKTPSFVIFPDNSFHCFGCKAHGRNAIDFVMKLGTTFYDAVTELQKY